MDFGNDSNRRVVDFGSDSLLPAASGFALNLVIACRLDRWLVGSQADAR
jgi:hypothetical protein